MPNTDTEAIGVKLTRAEGEVVIRWSEGDTTLTIYTNSPIWLRRIKRIADSYPEGMVEHRQGGVIFSLPVSTVSFRRKRVLSEAQQERLRERGRQLAASQRT